MTKRKVSPASLKDSLVIREIEAGEEFEVSRLVHRVFMEFIAPIFSNRGTHEVRRYARAERLKERLEEGCFILLALWKGQIVGMIEVKEEGHISLLFVDGEYQGKGIARKLINAAVKRCLKIDPFLKVVSVNSAPNSVKFYKKLGFVPTDSERIENGVRYVPMELGVGSEN
jgi:GNAT superfamily N-acetyltransferase